MVAPIPHIPPLVPMPKKVRTLNLNLNEEAAAATIVATIAIGVILILCVIFFFESHHWHDDQATIRNHDNKCATIHTEKLRRDCLTGIVTNDKTTSESTQGFSDK